jgi:hypothetical protein
MHEVSANFPTSGSAVVAFGVSPDSGTSWIQARRCRPSHRPADTKSRFLYTSRSTCIESRAFLCTSRGTREVFTGRAISALAERIRSDETLYLRRFVTLHAVRLKSALLVVFDRRLFKGTSRPLPSGARAVPCVLRCWSIAMLTARVRETQSRQPKVPRPCASHRAIPQVEHTLTRSVVRACRRWGATT